MTDFETFWKAYPKKVAKGDARKAWKQTDQIRPPIAELLEAIQAQCRSDQWRKNDGQFIPYPATFLRQERWSDELKVTLPGVVQGKEWYETWVGIQAKAHELGIDESQFTHPQEFKSAVMRASVKVA
jgi:hypothetical protein